MDIKNFVLSYYKNSHENFHIHRVEHTIEAQKPHTHDYFQIYFIAKGSLKHFVGNSSAHLNHGDLSIIPPGTTHYIAPEPDTVFYSFSFMENFLCGQQSTNMLTKNFLLSLQTDNKSGIRPRVSVSPQDILHVENIMKHILGEFETKPPAYHETIRAYAELLVIMLAREYFEKINPDISGHFENNKQFVLHSIEYIENNFDDNISLNEISKKSAMTKNAFCSIFMSLTGCSFNKYLNMCRIKKATEYINQGYKITAIYGLCGYNDFSTFYRNFKKIMGVSPQEYKNNSL